MTGAFRERPMRPRTNLPLQSTIMIKSPASIEHLTKMPFSVTNAAGTGSVFWYRQVGAHHGFSPTFIVYLCPLAF